MLRQSEIRKDYIQDKYVLIAPLRDKRPHDIERCHYGVDTTPKVCTFCPKNIKSQKTTLTIGTKNNWLIKVIANKYPALSIHNPRAYGMQEVVVETPEHEPELEDLPTAHIAKVLEVYALRTKKISQNKKIEYILIFKNNGGRAGASIMHAHSQVFATSFLPPHIYDKSQRVHEYKLKHGKCVYCEVIKKESSGPRLIDQDKYMIAFSPYASMYNYESWIMPQRHIDNITLLTKSERRSHAIMLKKILMKINKLGLPYNYYFHQVIHDEDQHLYMKIVPRGNVWAGVEIGSGLIINPIPPEDAARYYRS